MIFFRDGGARSARRTTALAFVMTAGLVVAAYAADPATVKIDNFTFTPAEISVPVGTTVTWENEDDIPHSIVLSDKSFHSKPLDTHDKASYTFAKPGDFDYFCGLHPHMKARIKVTP